MPRLRLDGLQKELLRAGIAPQHVRRTVDELNDHYNDLYDAARAEGADDKHARQQAHRSIGDLENLAAEIRTHPELRSWAYRYPHLALVVYPLTYLAVLPAVPVMMGVEHAGQIGRWAACLFLGGAVTAAIFLFMQLTITLT